MLKLKYDFCLFVWMGPYETISLGNRTGLSRRLLLLLYTFLFLNVCLLVFFWLRIMEHMMCWTSSFSTCQCTHQLFPPALVPCPCGLLIWVPRAPSPLLPAGFAWWEALTGNQTVGGKWDGDIYSLVSLLSSPPPYITDSPGWLCPPTKDNNCQAALCTKMLTSLSWHFR